MLRAFHYFSKDGDDVVLLVKVLTSSSRFSLLDVVSDVVPNKLSSGSGISNNNIIFFSDYLTDESMSCLYSMADFYLCASICEGQNLPLLEAMGHGVVPVTTGGTAMEDYITADNAVVIADHVIQNDCEHLAGTIAGRPFAIRRSYAEDIYDALLRSAALDASVYREMSERACRVVREQFSENVIWSRIVDRLEAIRLPAISKAGH
jgi:glycosyltransferase involved in cell wall biosynthesis